MDEYNLPDADGKFSNAPYFNFNDNKVKFNTNDVSNANENYGSASAVLPKSLFFKLNRSVQTGRFSNFLAANPITPYWILTSHPTFGQFHQCFAEAGYTFSDQSFLHPSLSEQILLKDLIWH